MRTTADYADSTDTEGQRGKSGHFNSLHSSAASVPSAVKIPRAKIWAVWKAPLLERLTPKSQRSLSVVSRCDLRARSPTGQRRARGPRIISAKKSCQSARWRPAFDNSRAGDTPCADTTQSLSSARRSAAPSPCLEINPEAHIPWKKLRNQKKD
jgi:hypothetical protein